MILLGGLIHHLALPFITHLEKSFDLGTNTFAWELIGKWLPTSFEILMDELTYLSCHTKYGEAMQR